MSPIAEFCGIRKFYWGKKKKEKQSQSIIKFLCVTQTKINWGDKHLLVSSAGSIRKALVIYLSIPNWLDLALLLERRQE